MNIKEEFKKFLGNYSEEDKNNIWKIQSEKFKYFWENKINQDLNNSEIDEIVRYIDTHGRGNNPSNESVARVMVPQGAWYTIFKNLKEQNNLRDSFSKILFPDDTTLVPLIIDKIFLLNANNKNHLTGKTGSGVSAFLAIADPFNNLSIVSLNDRYKILDFLELNYEDLKNKNIGEQIVKTNELILNYFIEKKISSNARTITAFVYSNPVVTHWKNKKSIIPDFPNIKKEFLPILKEEISYFDSKNSSEWAITLAQNKIRLHFGNFIVFTIENNYIWMAIDKDVSDNLNSLNYWKWDLSDYPEYKQYNLFSKNGFFDGSIIEWNKIKQYHYNFIDKIADKNYKLDSRTKKNHNNNYVVKLLEQNTSSFPLPSYVINDEDELNEIQDETKLIDFSTIDKTEKETIVKNRIGQNIFRENLIRIYGNCIICGLKNAQILRASHIKPWSECSNSERVNYNNGLLLCANHDLLFDRLLISFDENGEIIISNEIEKDIELLNIPKKLTIAMNQEQNEFMNWHRNKFYDKNNL